MSQHRGPLSLFERAKREREDEVYSVTQALKYVEYHVKKKFVNVQIQGEISRFMQRGGHWYFSLKDSRSALPCIMFRTKNERVRFRVEEGQQVSARGQITVYAPQARVQLEVNSLEPLGTGDELVKLEERKEAFRREGLFDDDKKRRLPFFPRTLGVVTSETGAVLRDVVRVVRDRCPGVSIVLSPTSVQGKKSAASIARALLELERAKVCDVIIVCRGGGSLEDLWGYQEDAVVRAIAQCQTPIVTGIGHQTDTTLADYVADVRAATPSQAAELCVPLLSDVQGRLKRYQRELDQQLERRLAGAHSEVQRLETRIGRHHPQTLLQEQKHRLRDLEDLLTRRLNTRLQNEKESLGMLAASLRKVHPELRLQGQNRSLRNLSERLLSAQPSLDRGQAELEHARSRLQKIPALLKTRAQDALQKRVASLAARSPLKVLERGYAVVEHAVPNEKIHRVVVDAQTLHSGDEVRLSFAKGKALARIERVIKEDSLSPTSRNEETS